jgi:heptosyltransferase-3
VIRPKKILVIKFRNIGDVLLTSPLISTLKRGTPAAKVYAAVKAGTEAMLEGHPDLETLYVLPKRNRGESAVHFLIRYLRWLRQLRREKFDLALNTTEGDRGIILSFLIGAKERWCELNKEQQNIWKRILLTKIITPPSRDTHTVLRNLHLATPFTVERQYSVSLHIDEKDRAYIKTTLVKNGYTKNKPLVHIHPTSRWFFKCLPNQTIAYTIDKLLNNNHQVVLTCAPNTKELEQLTQITSLCSRKPINFGGQLTLKQTAVLSEIADLFFGVDSAPMHMAAALNTPVVSIFGPSGAFNWGPWPNSWNSEANPYPLRNGFQANAHHLVIQKQWSCVPCGKDGCEGTKKSACLDCLEPELIYGKILEKIQTI